LKLKLGTHIYDKNISYVSGLKTSYHLDEQSKRQLGDTTIKDKKANSKESRERL
jgi:hypothetical protein